MAREGSTSVTLQCGGNCASPAGPFSVGQIVLLDENSGAQWMPEPCDVATSVWAAPDWTVMWKKRYPSLADDDFGASQPGTAGDGYSRLDRPTKMALTKHAGIDNVSVSNGDDDNIDFELCAYCWVKSVESSVWNGRGFSSLTTASAAS